MLKLLGDNTTDQQRMLTPPWHLILPSHLSGPVLCPTLDFVFALWFTITFDTLLTLLFYIDVVTE
jgi:hypothetical protein